MQISNHTIISIDISNISEIEQKLNKLSVG